MLFKGKQMTNKWLKKQHLDIHVFKQHTLVAVWRVINKFTLVNGKVRYSSGQSDPMLDVMVTHSEHLAIQNAFQQGLVRLDINI